MFPVSHARSSSAERAPPIVEGTRDSLPFQSEVERQWGGLHKMMSHIFIDFPKRNVGGLHQPRGPGSHRCSPSTDTVARQRHKLLPRFKIFSCFDEMEPNNEGKAHHSTSLRLTAFRQVGVSSTPGIIPRQKGVPFARLRMEPIKAKFWRSVSGCDAGLFGRRAQMWL